MNQEISVLCLIYWYNRNMVTEVKPEETTRAAAFNLWMTSPIPVQGKFLRYDKFAVNVIVQNKNDGARFLEELQKAVRE